jgi:hypothetical protein
MAEADVIAGARVAVGTVGTINRVGASVEGLRRRARRLAIGAGREDGHEQAECEDESGEPWSGLERAPAKRRRPVM